MSRRTRRCNRLSFALVAGLLSGNAPAIEPSRGVYRIPYANGTQVQVTRDHVRHGEGRVDMAGRGGGPHRIAAAADGTIRFIEDGFDKRIQCTGADNKPIPIGEQKNNFVWIEHANGEWSKYSHMAMGSTTGKANLRVGQFVTAGTYLGDEGDVGCASGKHLHFEIGVPRAIDPLTGTGGFLADNDAGHRNRVPRICGIAGGVLRDAQVHTARDVPGALQSGSREMARHGVSAADYQCLFDQAVNAGYALEWVDGFVVGGDVFYNAVFRPAGAPPWTAFHGLSGAQYQQRFAEFTGKGYRLHHVDSYGSGGDVRYAAIFRRQPGPAFRAYHGLSAEDHQRRMDAWTGEGYRPRNVSVASSGSQRRYTALYEQVDLGSWQSRSQLTAAQFQQAVDDHARAGRHVVYIDAYVHGGQPHFSAIWSSKAAATYRARHGMSGAQYQSESTANARAGHLTEAVSGYAVGNHARYAAIWRR
jgi:murein DD-endopeptidase MepM/ murein hydrolase activator NlpD